eukprot:TRINITY_DN1848_c0_g1_i2.p4 TRINITY_DN1848_c0_g1~~TRINITY_DN1848_c0_g1_i2.p4  ORF type:complete len:150 (+),score=28.52 TRINITY_DN1848_c0_g1_i2:211-660(+)
MCLSLQKFQILKYCIESYMYVYKAISKNNRQVCSLIFSCVQEEREEYFVEKKADNIIENRKSNLMLESRKKLTISGVIEVISFDEIKIDLTTKLGNLTIRGEDLKMNKLDVQNGDVMISGDIASMIYNCLLYTSPSPRDRQKSRMPSSA